MHIDNTVKINAYTVISQLVEEALDKHDWQTLPDPEDPVIKDWLVNDIMGKLTTVVDFYDQSKDGITFKTSLIVREAIAKGVNWGLFRAFKHTDTPSPHMINDHLCMEVLNSVWDVLQFSDTED